MTVREGLDPGRVRSAAESIHGLGQRTEAVHDQGSAMLTVLAGVWEGGDLESFERGWREAGPHVAAAAEALRSAAGELRRQAGDQESASAGEGGGGDGSGFPDFGLPDFDFPDLNPFDGFDWDLPDVDWPTMDIGGFLDGLGDGIVDLLETIGDWWDDIPWWGQLIIGVVVAAVAVVVAVVLGAPVGAAIAVVAAVVGAIMTILDIADALAEFFRDPGEFIDRLLEDPLAALGDLAWLLVGFLPYGIGKLLQRFRKPLRELVESIAPTLKRKLDEVTDWVRRKWDDLTGPRPIPDGQVRDEVHELDPGRSRGTYTVDSDEELRDFYERLAEGGQEVDPGRYPGRVVERPDGTVVRIRDSSKSGGATIDITYPDGTREKVHID